MSWLLEKDRKGKGEGGKGKGRGRWGERGLFRLKTTKQYTKLNVHRQM